ncbi:MAG: hypothetical protein FWC73_06545 [Defluviitaleaceae bacterium]|nr:hypothetical protein [Defluviitaleaceae bacterium]
MTEILMFSIFIALMLVNGLFLFVLIRFLHKYKSKLARLELGTMSMQGTGLKEAPIVDKGQLELILDSLEIISKKIELTWVELQMFGINTNVSSGDRQQPSREMAQISDQFNGFHDLVRILDEKLMGYTEALTDSGTYTARLLQTEFEKVGYLHKKSVDDLAETAEKMAQIKYAMETNLSITKNFGEDYTACVRETNDVIRELKAVASPFAEVVARTNEALARTASEMQTLSAELLYKVTGELREGLQFTRDVLKNHITKSLNSDGGVDARTHT